MERCSFGEREGKNRRSDIAREISFFPRTIPAILSRPKQFIDSLRNNPASTIFDKRYYFDARKLSKLSSSDGEATAKGRNDNKTVNR